MVSVRRRRLVRRLVRLVSCGCRGVCRRGCGRGGRCCGGGVYWWLVILWRRRRTVVDWRLVRFVRSGGGGVSCCCRRRRGCGVGGGFVSRRLVVGLWWRCVLWGRLVICGWGLINWLVVGLSIGCGRGVCGRCCGVCCGRGRGRRGRGRGRWLIIDRLVVHVVRRGSCSCVSRGRCCGRCRGICCGCRVCRSGSILVGLVGLI